MTISPVSFGNKDDYPDIPSWVNEPYERKRREMQRAAAESARLNNISYSRNNPVRQPKATRGDVFVSSKGSRVTPKKKPSNQTQKIRLLAAALAAAAAITTGAIFIGGSGGKDTPKPQPGVETPYTPPENDTRL